MLYCFVVRFVIVLKRSGHYMYHQFNIQQLYVLPTQCISVFFLWILEQTAIISLYSINWLVFVTETESVYCAVLTVVSQRRWWVGNVECGMC